MAVIRQHTRERPTIPLVTRFDPHDKLTSVPQPFLFQRVAGSPREVFSSTTVVRILGQLCAELAEDHREFADAKCTPHDFRRLLATDPCTLPARRHFSSARRTSAWPPADRPRARSGGERPEPSRRRFSHPLLPK